MNDLFSYVLICTYNGELFLKDQVNSIFNQTIPIHKLFIYDFGSTDKSIDLLFELQNEFKDKLLVYKFKKTNNVAKSFLIALNDISSKIQTNSLLYVCDQDDYWLINKNEYVLSNFYDSDLPIMFHHDVFLVNKNLEIINIEFYSKYFKKFLTKSIAHRSYINSIIGHTICMNYHSIKLLSSKKYDERIIMHDWFWGALIESKGVIIFLEKKLSYYRQHNFNQIGAKLYKSNIANSFLNIFKLSILISRQLDLFKSIEISETNKIRLFYFLCRTKNFKEAFSFLLKVSYNNFHKFKIFTNK